MAANRKAIAGRRAYKLALAAQKAAGDGTAHAPDVEACKSLREFTRQAWHAIEPGTPYLSNWHIDCICEHLEAVTAGQCRRLLINIPPRYMKCGKAGSLVWMIDGSRKPIEDVIPGDQVLSSDGDKVLSDRVTGAWASGVKRTLKITLSDGRLIEVTPEHRLYGWDRWVEAGQLKVGDPLCVSEETPAQFGTLTNDDAFLMGLWCAEGDKGYDRFHVTNGIPEIRARVERIAAERGWWVKTTGEFSYRISMKWARHSGTPLAFLRRFGDIKAKSTENIGIPNEVFQATDDVVAEFLSTFIACDGCIATRAVVVEAKSERMARDLQSLATRFGVRSTVVRKDFTQGDKPRTAWVWQVPNKRGIQRLAEVLSIPEKQGKLESLAARLPEKTAERSIPPEWRSMLTHKTWWHRNRGLRVDKPGWTDIGKVIKAAEMEGNAGLLAKVGSGLGWREIVSIEDGGEHETFDIETETHHAFFLSDVLSHNSILCSVMWPIWEWREKPEVRFMFTTYSGDLSKDHAYSRRTVLESDWFKERWGDTVKLTSDNIMSVTNDRRGVFTATSFTGSATGKGANRLVVDDPHNPKQADSDVERATTVRLFNTTFMNRLNNKFDDAIVVVMQRLHEEDVSARCIEQGYTHLCLPAESEGRTTVVFPMSGRTVVREPDELLWPEREGPDQIQEQKNQGSYYFAGQYQQQPAPAGGGMFTSFEVVDAAPKGLIQCRGWDKAGSEGKGDFSAGVLIGMTSEAAPTFYVLDITKGQWSAANREKVMRDTATMDGQATFIWVEQEGGSGGKDSADISIKHLAGFNAQKQVASGTGDKVARARPLAAQAEIGNVKLLRGDWNKAFVDEAQIFPNGKHDDQIDAASLAFNKLCLMPRPGPAAWGPASDTPPVPMTAGAKPGKPSGWAMGR